MESVTEFVGSTYSLKDLANRDYLESEYLYRNRKKFTVEGISLPNCEDVRNEAEYAIANQYVQESEADPSRPRHLVLANEYPSDSNHYANGFVHRRVALLKKRGLEVDVVAFGKRLPRTIYNYNGIRVLSGYSNELAGLLASRSYSSLNVHFLNSEMWNVLKGNIPKGTVFNVFVHGYEVRNWSRMPDDIVLKENLDARIERSLRQRDVWSELVGPAGGVNNFVFVSQWWKRAAEEDLRLTFPKGKSVVIHNVIDTELFEWAPKDPQQRFKLLWIRNAKSLNYGADLAAALLRRLRTSRWWPLLEVTIIGDGEHFSQFDEFVDEPNVIVRRGFISQEEIASQHKKHGIFLVPSRFDTQGVSRDEAMSSGLVPVTCPVAAVPEFVDDNCAILGSESDMAAWFERLESVLKDPQLFLDMSENAARRVRSLSSPEMTVEREAKVMEGSNE